MKSDITTHDVTLYFIPVETRVPLKFGPETLTSVICARVCITVRDQQGHTAQGWGETPLSVQWAWLRHFPVEVLARERQHAPECPPRALAQIAPRGH